MARFDAFGTEFSFNVLPLKLFSSGELVRIGLELKNEYVQYDSELTVSVEDLEHWIYAMFRLLAGAYAKEYTLSLEGAGIAVDLYPHTANGEEVSRQERRKNDCIMAIRLLMRSSNKKNFLGGVYSILLHREDIKEFAKALLTEYQTVFANKRKKDGKYLFVAVSPLGYGGCHYWYLDAEKKTKKGDYVWVTMGRRNTLQIVEVDDVRYFTDETAPYPPDEIKRVLKIATAEEIEKAKGDGI